MHEQTGIPRDVTLHHARRRRRGSVVITVLWAIALAALVASSVQLFSFRQAAIGRDTLHRVQARWAARAGIENSIAMMALHTEQPVLDDAFALTRDLDYVWRAELHEAHYEIKYHADGQDWRGPMDEHAKLNLNGAELSLLNEPVLEDITPDVVAAIRDWRDDDDDPGMLGAEGDYYLGMPTPYEPRNGPMRHIAELELVAGIWGDFVRGEDWNLNNRIDSNEDDGPRSMPEDQPDGYLETGWAGRLTVQSTAGGATASGFPRIYLRRADPTELIDRCGLSIAQAEALIEFGRNDQNSLTQLIETGLSGAAAGGAGTPGGGGASGAAGTAGAAGNAGDSGGDTGDGAPGPEPLTPDQLRSILAETSVMPLYERLPGKINLNTASPLLIEDLFEVLGLEQAMADEVTYMALREQGITSIMDLAEIPEMTPALHRQLADLFTTSGNVFTITSRGRSELSGQEVEIIAVVDRSSVPVRILEYREQ